MEPISALGLVGDIIGLIDASLRSVEVARRIYHSATGSTAENENLAFVAGEVRKRAMTLDSKRSTPRDTTELTLREGDDGQASLGVVAQKCCRTADDLLALLASMQAGQNKSLGHTMRATWRNFREKEEKNELVGQLEKLATQLHYQMTCVNQCVSICQWSQLIPAYHANVDQIGHSHPARGSRRCCRWQCGDD